MISISNTSWFGWKPVFTDYHSSNRLVQSGFDHNMRQFVFPLIICVYYMHHFLKWFFSFCGVGGGWKNITLINQKRKYYSLQLGYKRFHNYNARERIKLMHGTQISVAFSSLEFVIFQLTFLYFIHMTWFHFLL